MAEPSKEHRDKRDSKATAEHPEVDDELNELLDSALADFENEDPQSGAEQGGATAAPKASGEGSQGSHSKSSAGDPISDAFAEEFSEEMSKQFEDAMKSFMAEDPEVLAQIEKLAEVASTKGDSANEQKEFGDTLKETLASLAQNTEGLQDHPPGGPEDMMKMFAGLGLGGAGPADEESFMPMMQGMMQTLLSKDVLYPSLKEISQKYPKWLADNRSKIEESEYNNYTEQHKIIGTILTAFEAEGSTDTDDVKKQRFENIMDLMQQMQDLGQPPKEIVGEMAPGLDFDANGVPTFPGASESCCVM